MNSVETRTEAPARDEVPARESVAGFACVAAALVLMVCALHAPSKSWLLEYYANPALEGPAKVRAWMRRVNFEVPGGMLLARVPDREAFSVRFQSCLPVAEPTTLSVRLQADDRARFYVDGKLELDSAEAASMPVLGKRKRQHIRGRRRSR